MKAVDGDDFVDVRPAGSVGDLKCDGWSTSTRTCYAVYAPFTRKAPTTVRRKLEDDFRGALAAWPEMQAWRLVHNGLYGLAAPVAAALEHLRAEVSEQTAQVEILPPWGPHELSWMLRQAPRTAQWSVPRAAHMAVRARPAG
jgi:hypothetical protein